MIIINSKWAIGLSLIIAAAMLQGCSIIGLSAGAIIDRGKSNFVTVSGNYIGKLKPGQDCVLRLNNGDTVAGQFLGIEVLPLQAYAAKYAVFLSDSNCATFPAIGDSLKIWERGGDCGGIFNGFGYRYRAHISPYEVGSGCEYQYLSLRALDKDGERRLYLKDVFRVIKNDSVKVEFLRIKNLASAMTLPLQSVIHIHEAAGPTSVYLNDVKSVTYYNKINSAKMTGLVGGLVFDILLTIALLNFEFTLGNAENSPK